MLRKLFIATVVLALGSSAFVFGQESDPNVNPENVEKLPGARPIIEYALAGGFLLGALAIGFMPSKRTKET